MKSIFKFKQILILSFLFFSAFAFGQGCWKEISAGNRHTIAIKSDGTLWAWGKNESGELGNGSNISSNIPIQIGFENNWSKVSAGSSYNYNKGFSIAIKNDGTLWAWGENSHGELGDGTTVNKNIPIQIGSDNNWIKISSYTHTLAIKSNGTLWSWGAAYGIVSGLGEIISAQINPTQQGTNSNWSEVSAGNLFSICKKTDGTIWAKGFNGYGQLGLSNNIGQNNFIQIGNSSDWKNIRTGDSFTLAIKNDGTLWAWGDNNYGQLGNGTNSNTNYPTQINNQTDWKDIYCGGVFSFSIKNDGTLWGWGYNYAGNLGDGTNISKNYPIQIGSNSNWKYITASKEHTLGFNVDLNLFSWGSNYWGELGNNSNTNSNSPISISCPGIPNCITWTNPPTGNALTASEFLCSNNNIIQNTQNGTYNATTPIERQDIAKIAYLGLFGSNTPLSPAIFFPVPFSDMQALNPSNTYWYDAAKTLAYLQYADDKTPFDRDFINFRPCDPIARKYALKVFLETFNIAPSTNTNNPFSDVNTSDKMYGYIKKAHELGIISGTTFSPDANITREDAFIYLWKILSNSSITKPTYADVLATSNYFIPGNFSLATLNKVPSIDKANFNHYQKNVFSMEGRGVPLDFTFSYNSFLTEVPKGYFEDDPSSDAGQKFTPLGIGWTHTYNIYAQKITDCNSTNPEKLMVVYPDGTNTIFDYTTGNAEGVGIYDTMTKNAITGGERLTITTKGQLKYVLENYNNGKFYFLKSIKDRNNNGVQCTYDFVNNVYLLKTVQEISTLGDLGRTLTFSYNTVTNKLFSITDVENSRTVSFAVNNNDLVSYVDAKSNQTQYFYDDANNYLKNHLLTEIRLPKGNKIQNTYEQRKLKTTKTLDQANAVSSSSSVNWAGSYTNSGISSSASVTDAQNLTTNFQHNALGNPTSIISPTNTTTFTSYDAGNNANLPTSVNINGQNATVQYDNKGNVTSTTKNNITNTFTYTTFNDIDTYTDGNGNTTDYNYDTNGNLTQIIRPSIGGFVNITRNNYGQVQTYSNPSGFNTSYTYDAYGLNNSITKQNVGIINQKINDGASRVFQTTDGNNNTTVFQYDPNDNITQITDANNGIIQLGYDANDNQTSVINQKTETQTNVYNFDDDALKSTTFGGVTKNITYYPDGSVHTVTKGSSTLNYTYDTQGRVSSDGTNTYTYDSRNNIASVTNATYTVNIYYDLNDRIDHYTRDGISVYYTYDNNNNIKTIKYPNNNQIVEYNYDALNRMTSVKDWNNNITTYTYHTDDRIDRVDYPNSTYALYVYDNAGRMIGLKNKRLDGSIISEYSYTLDNVGNHLTETTNDSFTASAIATIQAETVNYPTMNNNKIQQANSNINGSRTFMHNNIGAISQDGNLQLNYNNLELLTSITGSTPLTNDNDYFDGLNCRVQKTDINSISKFWYDIQGSKNVLWELNQVPSPVTHYYYVYGADGLISRIDGTSGATQYYHYDYRGSTTAITNSSGVITHNYAYDPFGKILVANETNYNRFRYVGKYGVQYDSPRKYYMRARNYDPTIGRFISEDPIWNLNLYNYADNNPIMKIDPKGTFPLEGAIEVLKESIEPISKGIGQFQNSSTYVPYVKSTFEIASEIKDQKDAINLVNSLNNTTSNVSNSTTLTTSSTAVAGGTTISAGVVLWWMALVYQSGYMAYHGFKGDAMEVGLNAYAKQAGEYVGKKIVDYIKFKKEQERVKRVREMLKSGNIKL